MGEERGGKERGRRGRRGRGLGEMARMERARV